MKWKKTSEQKPAIDDREYAEINRTLCLTISAEYIFSDDYDDIRFLYYNHDENCWDSENDYECDFYQVEYFFEVHLLEFEK